MNIGEKMHGFQVEKVTELQELDAKLIEMLHEQTGLRLIWLDREEETKRSPSRSGRNRGTTRACSTFWSIPC